MPPNRRIIHCTLLWLISLVATVDRLAAQVDLNGESRLEPLRAAVAACETARHEAELSADPAATLGSTRKSLRAAISDLQDLHESVVAQIRKLERESPDAGDDRLRASLSVLELHTRYQLSKALANHGLCHPLNSPDRVNSLAQSVEVLSALGARDLTPQLAWQVRLDELAGLREIGNYGEAEKKLAAISRAAPPAETAARLRAERIKLALARGRIDEALSEAGGGAHRSETSSAELELARLDAYLAAWKRAPVAGDNENRARWKEAAVAVVGVLRDGSDRLASRRAEATLARAMLRDASTDNPQVLLQAAQSLYRAGQLEEALPAYEAAAERARAANDKDTYFDSHYAVGALLFELQRFGQSAERLRALALALPQHERAAQAHLLAIQAAGQEARRQNPPRLDGYRQLLQEHAKSWPDSDTAAQVWWWMGRIEEHERSWQEAIRAFKQIKPQSDHFADGVAAIGRCYEATLDDLRARGNANDLLARDAIAYLQSVAKRPAGASTTRIEAARNAILAMARIQLKESPTSAAAVRRALAEALDDDPRAPAEWRRQAQLLLIPALAADGQVDAAEKLLERLPIGSTDQSMALVDLLSAVGRRATAEERRAVARVELAVIGDLLARPDDLPTETVKRLAARRVETLVDLGDRDQALAALRKLASDHPRDGQLQESLARLLSAGDDETSQQAAALKWREVAQHCRPGSDRWFRAHLELARLQLKLGNPAQARSTVRLVESSQPDLGGPELKAQFRQLLAECDRTSAARPASQ